MKKIVIFLLITFIFSACSDKNEPKNDKKTSEMGVKTSKNNFGIILHGGAGTILKENMSDSLEAAYKEVLERAIQNRTQYFGKRRCQPGSNCSNYKSYGRFTAVQCREGSRIYTSRNQ